MQFNGITAFLQTARPPGPFHHVPPLVEQPTKTL
jgi:hypothetical protein